MFPAMQIIAGAFSPVHPLGTFFWQRPQVQDIDFGVTPPDFLGDITLRGGICRLMVGAYPENVNIRVKVFAVWANKNPDADLYTAVNNTNKPLEFDPTLIPDFTTKFGRILYTKEAMVPQGETFEVVHRLKPQKIDRAVFTGELAPIEPAGSQLWWMLMLSPLDSNALAAAVTVTNSYNVSFSADASVPP